MLLVIYDLSDDKRRRELVKSLESYGKRVQESAFEMELANYERKRMIKEIKSIIDYEADNVRIYNIPKDAIPEIVGIDSSPISETNIII